MKVGASVSKDVTDGKLGTTEELRHEINRNTLDHFRPPWRVSYLFHISFPTYMPSSS